MEGTVIAIHQPNYFPWLGFAHKMMNCDIFVLLDTVQFPRRNYVNRTHIRVKDEPRWLTVPVSGDYHDTINRIRIANGRPWQRKHLKTIETNYGRARFFPSFMPRIENILLSHWSLLADLNLEICDFYKTVLGLDTKLVSASQLDIDESLSSTGLLVAIVKALSGSFYLAGASGRKYMEMDLFEKVGIKVLWQEFHYPTYPQTRPGMVPNLSSIDAFFNCGRTETKRLLEGIKKPRTEDDQCC